MPRTMVKKQDFLKLEMRRILGDAYAFVRGSEYTKTAAAITYEQMIDEAINDIEGTKGRKDDRATKLERIKRIKQEVSTAVTTVKKRDADEWGFDGQPDLDKEDLANTAEKTSGSS